MKLVMSFVGWVVYTASLFLSIALYRGFFHQLRRSPGPPLMAISKLTHVYCSRRWDNYKQLEALRSYRDFVRAGKAPTIKALDIIYLSNARLSKLQRTVRNHYLSCRCSAPDPWPQVKVYKGTSIRYSMAYDLNACS